MPRFQNPRPSDNCLVNLTGKQFDNGTTIVVPGNVNLDYTTDDVSYEIVPIDDPYREEPVDPSVEFFTIQTILNCVQKKPDQSTCSNSAFLIASLCATHKPKNACGFVFDVPSWFGPYLEMAFRQHPRDMQLYHLDQHKSTLLAIPGIVTAVRF